MMKDWNYENEQWTKLPGHLKHLPLFTRHLDFVSLIFRLMWGLFLKIAFRFYIYLIVKGSFHELYKTHKRLIIISNHSSHLDAVSITAAVPFQYWLDLYITAAKDYWFKNSLFTFFSAHCLGAIPIDRKDKKGEAIHLCTSLLENLERIWLIMFPEGTRSPDGYVKEFKRGVSIFSQKTKTPILFLYLEGNAKLFPKGRPLPIPGFLTVHIGPIIPPSDIETINSQYRKFALSINPNAYGPQALMPEQQDLELEDEFDESASNSRSKE